MPQRTGITLSPVCSLYLQLHIHYLMCVCVLLYKRITEVKIVQNISLLSYFSCKVLAELENGVVSACARHCAHCR